MADGEEWPPRSPLKALLSSPSGRKRYREHQVSGMGAASPAKLLGSPSLLERLRAARADRDEEFLQSKTNEPTEDEDDEETLQLKLQAIEAKLKLKKLQQQKARDTENVRPNPSGGSLDQPSRGSSRLEVALSPTKHLPAPILRSPSRVVLGIDKGVNAADVSLKRARVGQRNPSKKENDRGGSRASRPSSTSAQSSRSNYDAGLPPKTFSERMAEMRNKDKVSTEKKSVLQSTRSSRFQMDKSEVEGYKIAAEPILKAPDTSSRALSPTGADAVAQNRSAKPQALKHSRSLPSIRSKSPSKDAHITHPRSDTPNSAADEEPKGDPSLYEPYSNTHLSTRILPHSFLKRTLPSDQFEIFTLRRLLKEVVSPTYEMSDTITDYVVFGIIASKSSPRDHKARSSETNSTSSASWEKKWDDGTMNRQKFIVMTLTDLKWTIDLFLFDTAVPRYHRLTPGTLIAILNPSIMPPKRGREDTGAFSLAIHNGEDQILEIGTSKHLSHCTSKRKDGTLCGTWIDGSKTSTCEWHLNAELDRTRSKRMGVNTMGDFNSKAQGQGKSKEKNFRHGFDSEAQSFYYAIGGTAPKKEHWSFAPTYNSSLSTAQLLDSTNPDGDPFIAEGQMLERDKQDRLRKRMVAMEKEREIARRLGDLGHKGGAGGEYFRQRAAEGSGSKSSSGKRADGTANRLKESNGIVSGPGITKDDILRDGSGESKKRAAESVRLSPVKKKTRFLTSGGIKEAGRDSLGPGSKVSLGLRARGDNGDTRMDVDGNDDDDDDDDDDLDII